MCIYIYIRGKKELLTCDAHFRRLRAWLRDTRGPGRRRRWRCGPRGRRRRARLRTDAQRVPVGGAAGIHRWIDS